VEAAMANFTINQINVQVFPHVVAGTRRGGEDLFIRVEARSGSKNCPQNPTHEELDREMRFARETEDWSAFVPGDRVHCQKGSYRFTYSQSWGSFVELVHKAFEEGDWKLSSKTGQWSLIEDTFINGNAD
jgi:hypothetical protein